MSSRTSSASAGSQKKGRERETETKRERQIETGKEELESQHGHTAPAAHPPDVGKTLPRETMALQRTASGPPYSVFSAGMKSWIIFLVSISALISPFGATLVLPALTVLTGVLDITPTQANISITTYMVSLSSHSRERGRGEET